MTWLTSRLLARHARNVAKANPWPSGHGCVTTRKAAEMPSEAPSSDSQPLIGAAYPLGLDWPNEATSGAEMDAADVVQAAMLDTIVRLTHERDETRAKTKNLTRINEVIMATSDAERTAAAKALRDASHEIALRDAKIERMTYERSHPFGEAIQKSDDRRSL